jgi:anti-sigma factor RsiW
MNQRDVEQLSALLDGQLSPSDSARLKTRLASETLLTSTLDALRESRMLLRRLPHRRAPRNFLLSPKMVGQKPPLPRSYPVFRFATALATILFALSFVTSQVGKMAASAPAPAAYGIGGGGGMATEAPALESVPAVQATEPPAAPEVAPTEMALVMPNATLEPSAIEQNRAMEEPASPKTAEEPARPLLTTWQVTFLILALLGALCMFLIQRFAIKKWRSK